MALTGLEPFEVVPQFLGKNQLRRLLMNPDVRETRSADPADESHKIFHGKWTVARNGAAHVEINDGSVSYYDFHFYIQIRNLDGVPTTPSSVD